MCRIAGGSREYKHYREWKQECTTYRESPVSACHSVMARIAHRPVHIDLLVRAAYHRSVDDDTRLPDAAIATCPIAGTVTLEVPRRPQQPPRPATLTMRWLTVRFDPPKSLRQRATLPRPPVQVVVVEEQHPPNGVPALRWVLLTTVPVTTFEEALEIVRWYRTRWLIERYQFVLKRGGGVERLQLETAARLERALAVYCIVAWRLVWLTYEARQSPTEPCTLVVAPHEWQALALYDASDADPHRYAADNAASRFLDCAIGRLSQSEGRW